MSVKLVEGHIENTREFQQSEVTGLDGTAGLNLPQR